MRLYTFTNMYLSSIQNGIQTAHIITELFNKYGNDDKNLMDWNRNHKTIIVCKGGNQSELNQIHKEFERLATRLMIPFAKFHEEENALNGALTAVGIILPEEIYNPVYLPPYEEFLKMEFTDIDFEHQQQLSYLIKSYKLAS